MCCRVWEKTTKTTTTTTTTVCLVVRYELNGRNLPIYHFTLFWIRANARQSIDRIKFDCVFVTYLPLRFIHTHTAHTLKMMNSWSVNNEVFARALSLAHSHVYYVWRSQLRNEQQFFECVFIHILRVNIIPLDWNSAYISHSTWAEEKKFSFLFILRTTNTLHSPKRNW